MNNKMIQAKWLGIEDQLKWEIKNSQNQKHHQDCGFWFDQYYWECTCGAMTWEDRIANYTRETGFPRSLFVADDGRVVGTWILGNNYQVKSKYYGGYPNTYLKRVKALFPDKNKALHLFSGRVDLSIFPGDTVDLNPDMNPTYLDDAQNLENVPLEQYDIILSDPPYGVEDAEHYQTTMVKRNKVMRALQRVKPGTHIVWLDQTLPMWRKEFFSLVGAIGIMRSTNHRFRIASIIQRLESTPSPTT